MFIGRKTQYEELYNHPHNIPKSVGTPNPKELILSQTKRLISNMYKEHARCGGSCL
jgi:hypothetical protein